jgi:HPt (histidine-containing phosphotransfer) domain-containing protein
MKETATDSLPTSKEEITDLGKLLQYSDDEQFILKMIDSFLNTVPIELQKMERAIFLNDIDTVKFISHRMKTSLSYMGISIETRNLLDKIENCSLEEFLSEKIILDFAELKNTCQKAEIELKQKEKKFILKTGEQPSF